METGENKLDLSFDKIIGIIFLPVSLILFANIMGIMQMESIIGINLLLIASLSLIILQVANIISSHIDKHHIGLSYLLHGLMIFPSIIYFLSAFVAFPETLITSLPAIFASFIFVEGIYSFFI